MSEPILAVAGLTKRFRGVVAVNDVSIAVPEGSICSLIGPNGAGKSSFFNLVTGYLPPSAGEIRFQGRRIDGLDTHRIAQLGIARCFQIAKPFPELSVLDNVRMGALFGRAGARDVETETAAALALAGLSDLADRPAISLTVGYLRRLELARAIAQRPLLLLADEPCAGLNPTETEEVVDILRQVRQRGVTVLLVEHDMRAVMRVSDHIFVLDAGSKIAEGEPDRIARDPRVIAAYLGTPEPAGPA
ncbi:MAG: ABC transporter ATP-binding protein [Alphaproteobacteria bacterium]|nr:ABC transporter ATP-binding protein [Alphaproteobacteria bacterium]